MLEIVFSDSVCGSLKMAQHYGQGAYPGGCIGVIISRSDGRKPSKREKRAAQREAEEAERLAWESGAPMGGNTADVYGFGLMLSIGDISEDAPGMRRRQALEQLYGVFPRGTGQIAAQELLLRANSDWSEVQKRAAAGEAIRIWYSNQPDELCGFYWMMARLTQWGDYQGPVYAVQLPEWESDGKGNTKRMLSWGEIGPGEWYRYPALQKLVPPALCQSCADDWRILQEENAPLRAMLNGRLTSVPETLYDAFIRREISAQAGAFQEERLIGRMIEKYKLGIGDAWIALRIEEMIRSGELEALTEPEEDMPLYHRFLKKHGER